MDEIPRELTKKVLNHRLLEADAEIRMSLDSSPASILPHLSLAVSALMREEYSEMHAVLAQQTPATTTGENDLTRRSAIRRLLAVYRGNADAVRVELEHFPNQLAPSGQDYMSLAIEKFESELDTLGESP